MTFAMQMKLTGTRCQCSDCGEYFNRTSVFDKHRIGRHGVDRHCRTAKEMVEMGWSKNAAGFWMGPGKGYSGFAQRQSSGDHA